MTAATHVRNRYAIAVALTFALAACGGGGDKVPTVQDDAARAKRIVLQQADVPDLEKQDDDTEDDESDPFRKCLNDNQLLADLGEGPRSAQATYGSEDETLVRSSAVTLAENEGDAKAAFAEVNRPSFVGCFENAIRTGFETELGDEVDLQNLSVAELPVEKRGDEAVGYRATLDVVGGANSASFAFDYVFLRVDRAVTVLFSFDINDTFPTAERERLSEAITDRMNDEV